MPRNCEIFIRSVVQNLLICDCGYLKKKDTIIWCLKVPLPLRVVPDVGENSSPKISLKISLWYLPEDYPTIILLKLARYVVCYFPLSSLSWYSPVSIRCSKPFVLISYPKPFIYLFVMLNISFPFLSII